MKDFDAWMRTQAASVPATEPDEAMLPDGLWPDGKGVYRFKCLGCGGEPEWYGEPHEYDINKRECNFGGCGPHCIP